MSVDCSLSLFFSRFALSVVKVMVISLRLTPITSIVGDYELNNNYARLLFIAIDHYDVYGYGYV